jgi:hypothetical protein
MSLLKKYQVQFGEGSKEYGEEPTFSPTLIFNCRFFEKKAISTDLDDEFLNFDSTIVVDNYRPKNGDYCKILGFDNFYKVVDVAPLQTLNNSNQKYSIRLKLES